MVNEDLYIELIAIKCYNKERLNRSQIMNELNNIFSKSKLTLSSIKSIEETIIFRGENISEKDKGLSKEDIRDLRKDYKAKLNYKPEVLKLVENETYIIRNIEDSKNRPCGIRNKSDFCRFNPQRSPLSCRRSICKCDEELYLHRCKGCEHSDKEGWCTLMDCIFEYNIEAYHYILEHKIKSYQFTIPIEEKGGD